MKITFEGDTIYKSGYGKYHKYYDTIIVVKHLKVIDTSNQITLFNLNADSIKVKQEVVKLKTEYQKVTKKDVVIESYYDTVKVIDMTNTKLTIEHSKINYDFNKTINYDSIVDYFTLPLLLSLTVAYVFNSFKYKYWTKLIKELVL
jgi:hypothetical protein